jgi:peptidoglycan hydrolase-like protein with peptidoglycan-binding domain
MANYVMAGYTTPAGVTDAEGVRKMQQMLGVKADGIWGPQTQRAYDARMDEISDSYYPNNEKNARMREVSASYHSNSTQYQAILGISDPAFSGGDSFVAYANYLNERAQRNESAVDDKPLSRRRYERTLRGMG